MKRERLYWQCRRGMLELDYLLREILDQRYDNFSVEEQALLVELLKESDLDLHAWMVSRELPVPVKYRAII